jgi:CHAT domain-containing protein
MIHYAGHAFFDERQRSRSGIICADGKVLSGAELAGLSRLPSLIFFNACEAARVRNRVHSSLSCPVRERITRSVSFAEAYLRGGIANFIGTYWPVEDGAAAQFARTFYASLLRGSNLGSAICESRICLQRSRLIDWADYVHYGDHEFQVKVTRG